jgi:hypothetical protein
MHLWKNEYNFCYTSTSNSHCWQHPNNCCYRAPHCCHAKFPTRTNSTQNLTKLEIVPDSASCSEWSVTVRFEIFMPFADTCPQDLEGNPDVLLIVWCWVNSYWRWDGFFYRPGLFPDCFLENKEVAMFRTSTPKSPRCARPRSIIRTNPWDIPSGSVRNKRRCWQITIWTR